MLELKNLRRFAIKNAAALVSIAVALVVGLWVKPPIHWTTTLFASIGLFLIGFIFDRLRDLRELITQGPVFYRDQVRATRGLIEFIFTNKPRSADLLEYSSATVQAILSALITESESNIRLLLKHPKKGALPPRQGSRICERIHALYAEHKDYDRLKVQCYEEEASLRGRIMGGELLNIGWYTHERRNSASGQIQGHTNCLVTIRSGTAGYDVLASWFSEVFRLLWKNGHNLQDVCKGCTNKPEPEDEYDRWLNRVSEGGRK